MGPLAVVDPKPSVGQGAQLRQDGSQSLEVPAEQGAVLRRATEEFEQRVFLSTLNDIRNFCEAYGIEEPRSKSGRAGFQGSSSSS